MFPGPSTNLVIYIFAGLFRYVVFWATSKHITYVYSFNIQKNGAILREEDVVVDNVKIDLTRGKHNPLERYFKRVGIYAESEEVISFPT